MIVELEVAGERHPRLARRGILVEVHLLVFNGAPQAFGKHVVQCSSASIHADAHTSYRYERGVLRTGKVAALIAIQNLGCGLCQRVLDGPRHERLGQGLIELPTYHIAGVPIQYGDQIEPAVLQANIGDVDAPNVVRMGGCDIPQQVRIDRLLMDTLAEVRSWRNCLEAHLAHMPRHRFMVDQPPFPPELGCDATHAVERPAGVDRINLMFEGDLFCGGRDGSVVQTGAIETQQRCLRPNR